MWNSVGKISINNNYMKVLIKKIITVKSNRICLCHINKDTEEGDDMDDENMNKGSPGSIQYDKYMNFFIKALEADLKEADENIVLKEKIYDSIIKELGRF